MLIWRCVPCPVFPLCHVQTVPNHLPARTVHAVGNIKLDAVQGLGGMELDNLRDWEAKFHYKYPIVGSLVS